MERGEDWDDLTLETEEDVTEAQSEEVVCLTLIAHPDPTRIGERAFLECLRVRRAVPVSRFSPDFVAPSGGSTRALLDPYLSRSPMFIRPGPTPETVILDPNSRAIEAGGEALHAPRAYEWGALRHGVSIRISDRVAFLLHLHTQRRNPSPRDVLIGASDAIERVRRQIGLVASLEAAVLIVGESGTGKELVAHSIHATGSRSRRPLHSVNMATLSASTAASLLFGHVRGAFTGAERRHIGLFQRAHLGTVFLDEIGDTPVDVQPMLLRAIETRRVLPVGGEGEVPADVRVISATDRDLREQSERAFRASLLYRIAAFSVEVPPLRERRDDIPRLFLHFLSGLDGSGGGSWLEGSIRDRIARIPASTMLWLVGRPFPGNVRDLRQLTSRLYEASQGYDQMRVLRESTGRGARDTNAPLRAVERDKRPPQEDLASLLASHGWSPRRVAATLGVPNSTVHYWMKANDLTPRAIDLTDEQISQAAIRCAGDVGAMAAMLRTSVRGLRLRMRRAAAR